MDSHQFNLRLLYVLQQSQANLQLCEDLSLCNRRAL